MAIKKDQTVEMNYELKINEEMIEDNMDGESIKFVYGSGQIIPGLESRIEDMNIGESKTINVPSNEAYGEYDEALSQILPIEEFEGINLEIGMVLEGEEENQEVIRATVTEVTNEDVTVDYNHPLAGCDLEFTILIKSIS
ncbi:FKBP-type peptidyl-prolyl cis-trans isomerase [Poseidonibacter lekithochrous]|uniref:FKBP-type peptidyl-prolyl cis-trans isomerase n=1 Tax=Poseidonibacter lekithochrous TaxID=1904463 RepID=UPI0008FCAC51|nr:FKBP-type peptidyl-prolyl cis-trans isomerase [Poseidonibacter lekithochrous]QKJ22875.1 FKBP-type peptidyl-prolyl cis-trans isomerase [Poseidonibacter lekithochrous]